MQTYLLNIWILFVSKYEHILITVISGLKICIRMHNDVILVIIVKIM